MAYYEPAGGFVRPEACIEAQLQLAVKAGAQLHMNEKVSQYNVTGDGVEVITNKGKYTARKLVIAAGPWLPELIDKDKSQYLKVRRQVQFWFDIESNFYEQYTAARFPVFIWELQNSKQAIYGFPAVDGDKGGLKIATEQYENSTTADTVNRNVTPEEISLMYETYVRPYFKGIPGKCIRTAVCLYTVTPGSGFIIDFHPEHRDVLIVSACSGHGFKHSAAIGEAISELIINVKTSFDLGSFKFGRFGGL